MVSRSAIVRAQHVLAHLVIGLLCASPQMKGAYAQETPSERRPNILYIMSDDHALRSISAYGSGLNRTPNLDRLAREGALFTHAFVGNSICGPSRAAILSGTHSHVNGVTGNGAPWDSTQTIFPRLLRDAGYRTGLIGKWHLNNRPADEYDSYRILTGAGKQGFYYNPEFYDSATGTENVAGYSTDLITDYALDWLEGARETEQPFLLLVQYKAPHVPRMPPLRLLDRYLNDTLPEPPTLHDGLATRSRYARQVNFFLDAYRPLPPYAEHTPDKRNIYFQRMTEEEIRAYHAVVDPQEAAYARLLAEDQLRSSAVMRSYVYQRFIKDYLRMVDVLDENIGRLLDWLDAHPALRENTVVVYASDQGFFTGEHGYAEKRLMYEEAMHMPLLVRWPGAPEGRRIEALVQNIDFAPTFLDLAGLPIPARMQGRSFLPLLRGETPPDWRQSVYYHYYDHLQHRVGRHAGVRTDRYKLIHFYTDDTWECYDLARDPLELHNVYGNPDYADEIAALKTEYERLKTVYAVPPEHFEPPFEAN